MAGLTLSSGFSLSSLAKDLISPNGENKPTAAFFSGGSGLQSVGNFAGHLTEVSLISAKRLLSC